MAVPIYSLSASNPFSDNFHCTCRYKNRLWLEIEPIKFPFTTLQNHPDLVCGSQKSAQQVLFELYTAVALTELKGYAMLQTSWSILRALGVGNFNREANLMRQRFESRMRGLQNLMRTEVGQSGSTVLRCNPTEHVEGRTYERLTKLLQGSIERQDKLPSTGVFQRPPFCLGSCLKSNGSASATSNFLYCDNVPAELWTCPAVRRRDG